MADDWGASSAPPPYHFDEPPTEDPAPPSTWTHDESESAVDRRYLELRHALVDATNLHALPRAEPLIEGVLYRDSLNWLHGKPGHGKSFVALDIAAHTATDTPWHDNDTHGGPVLYVLAEGAHGMHDRRRAWETANQQTIPAGRLHFLPVAVQINHTLDIAAITQLATDLEPALIIIDTQARVTVGADENSAKDMGLFVDHLDRLRTATRACILVVHHESRAGDTLRGSTALEGAATTVIRATKEHDIVRLDNTKQKDSPPFDPIIGRLTSVALPDGHSAASYSHRDVGVRDLHAESENTLLTALREHGGSTGISSTALQEVSGLSSTTFYRARNALVTAGLMTNLGTPKATKYIATGMDTLT